MISASQCRAARGLLNWTQADLAVAAEVGIVTVRQFEAGNADPRRATLAVLTQALETAGVEFIPENGGGAGVRLKRKPLAHGIEHLHLVWDRTSKRADVAPLLARIRVEKTDDGLRAVNTIGRACRIWMEDGRVVGEPLITTIPGSEDRVSEIDLAAWVRRAGFDG